MWLLSLLLWLITMGTVGFGIVQMVRILLLVTKHSTELGQQGRIYALLMGMIYGFISCAILLIRYFLIKHGL